MKYRAETISAFRPTDPQGELKKNPERIVEGKSLRLRESLKWDCRVAVSWLRPFQLQPEEGLATAAFYTPAQDAIGITNPTPTSYPSITITFANPGISATQGTLYTIESGAQINASTISFATQGTSRSATIPVPPYSVQAISLK